MFDPSEFESSDESFNEFDALDGVDLIDLDETLSSLDVPIDPDELDDVPY